MSNKDEEKATEIAHRFPRHVQAVEYGCLLMAAWKDKQFTDRVEMTLCIDCHEFESCENCPKYQIKKELLGL